MRFARYAPTDEKSDGGKKSKAGPNQLVAQLARPASANSNVQIPPASRSFAAFSIKVPPKVLGMMLRMIRIANNHIPVEQVRFVWLLSPSLLPSLPLHRSQCRFHPVGLSTPRCILALLCNCRFFALTFALFYHNTHR